MERVEIAIVGGGQAGLAAAHAARAAGLSPVVLEAGSQPVGSWPRYYDSLTLFSPARYAALPGMPFPGDPERYPARDEVVEYLRRYAAWLAADVRCGQRVTGVRVAAGGGFEVDVGGVPAVRADRLIAASGGFGSPYVPRLPGLDGFRGEVLHAADYRTPERFAGRRVVVVGGGNSAVQIAVELAEAATVTIATRDPLNFRRQRPLGRDIHWWLTVTGLDTSPLGHRLLGGGTVPVLDDGRYRRAVKAGRPDRRPMFERLDGDGAVWADGGRERVDAVLLATGYRPALGYLAGTGALDREDRPVHRRGVSSTVPGLAYVGLEHQRSIASATIRGAGADAAHVIGELLGQGAPAKRRPRPALRALCCPTRAA